MKRIAKDFTTEQLPSNRKELFFDIIKNHYPLLIGLALLMFIFCIPLLGSFFVSDFLSGNLEQSLKDGVISQQEHDAAFRLFRLIISGAQVLCLCILSIGMAGITKVFKRLLFLEPVFFKEDFKLGVKDSWKSMLLIYFILGVFMMGANMIGTIPVSPFVRALPIGIIIAFVFPVFLLLNTNVTIYSNNYFKRLNICSLIYGKHFFLLFGISVLAMSPALLFLIGNPLLRYIFLLIIFLFIYPLIIVMYFDAANHCYDKELNVFMYKEIYRKGLFGAKDKEEDKKE